jgi:hypothetical protein
MNDWVFKRKWIFGSFVLSLSSVAVTGFFERDGGFLLSMFWLWAWGLVARISSPHVADNSNYALIIAGVFVSIVWAGLVLLMLVIFPKSWSLSRIRIYLWLLTALYLLFLCIVAPIQI